MEAQLSQMLPGGLLERLGILKASWRRLGGLLGRPGSLLGRSWASLGGILERSWACLGRYWAGLGGILRAKRLPEEAQEGPKSSRFVHIFFRIDFGCVLGTPKS